jgi:hypothetical protein
VRRLPGAATLGLVTLLNPWNSAFGDQGAPLVALGLQKGRELPRCRRTGFAAFGGDFLPDLRGPQYVANSLVHLRNNLFWRARGGQDAGPDAQFIV